MSGIEKLRDVCKALKGSPWCGTDIATIGGEPAYEKLSKIADQIERETLPRPLFEDGEPVQFGDEFVSCNGPRVVVGIKHSCEGGISLCDTDGEFYRFVGCERVKRPEPTDTWERVKDDMVNKVSPCGYFGWSDKSCCDDEGCPAYESGMSCAESMANDLVRRCKALARVE